MVNRLNRCNTNLTATPTSSCTEYLSNSYQGRCNNERCQRSCYFVNDHTYTILKKICRRMIKDYDRTQCREKYNIFDGGNSINVRVHRSDTHGNRTCRQDDKHIENNQRCQSVSTDPCRSRQDPGLSRRLDTETDKYKERQQRSRSEKDGRVGDKFGTGDDGSFRHKGRGKYAKSDVNDDESHLRKGQRSKHKDDVDDIGYDQNGKKGRTKSSTGGKDVVDTDERRMKGKSRANKKDEKGDNDYNDKEQRGKSTRRSKSSGGKNGNNDNDMDKAVKRRKEKRNDDNSETENMNEKTKKGDNGKTKGNSDKDYDEEGAVSGGVGKKGSTKGKRNKRKTKDADYEQDDNLADEKGEKKLKGRKFKRNYDDDTEDEKNKKKGKGKKNRSSIYSNDRVITDLRKKVRNGEKVGPLDGRFSKNKRGFSEERGRKRFSGKNVRLTQQQLEDLQYRKLKSTRADEAKACDYLRANMEQRDLCQLVCTPGPYVLQTFPCNPCPRTHCSCPNPCLSCCPNMCCKC